MRMISERAIEMQQDLPLSFIDHSRAFDYVKHDTMMDILQSLDIDVKDIRILRNVYWEQTAGVRIQSTIGRYSSIERGVRQGYTSSPDLSNLYNNMFDR